MLLYLNDKKIHRNKGCFLTKSVGFILLPLLIMILVISLFGLYVITTAGLSMKVRADAWEQNRFVIYLDEILQDIEANINEKNATECRPEIRNVLSFTENLTLSDPYFRQKFPCRGTRDKFKKIDYYYAIENLGQDNCARIKNFPDFVANYYRVTLFATDSADERIIMQTTYVRGVKTTELCAMQDSLHNVLSGRQMQRELLRRI